MLAFGNNSTGSNDYENTDALTRTLVSEAVLLEALSPEEMEAIAEDSGFARELIADEIVTERTIVKFDKYAKLSRAKHAAIFALARKHKDVKFKKLLTIWRIERQLEKYLMKKYGMQAERIAKQSLRNKKLPEGKGAHKDAVRKAITKAKGQLNTK